MTQVEVQCPPGLEMRCGGLGTSFLIGQPGSDINSDRAVGLNQSSSSRQEEEDDLGGEGGSSLERDEYLKEELVREVTGVVRQHLESKTAAAAESLWQRGQKAMQQLQMQQVQQAEKLQGQLAACRDSYQKLEQENAMLRGGLEALMKHLTLVFGAPPHQWPPEVQSPFFPQPMPRHAPQAPSAAPGAPKPSAAPVASPTALGSSAKPASGVGRIDPEDFHTPAASPLPGSAIAPIDELLAESPTSPLSFVPGLPAAAMAAATVASASSGRIGSDSGAPVTTKASHGSQPFTLTLRRAEQVPLGLEIRGDTGASFLTVNKVMPGGAVEAWNRQCTGDAREIKAGDHIININGAEEADLMCAECVSKHLLKMTVLRGPHESAPCESLDASVAPVAVSTGFGLCGSLRADADEFVPQVGPWSSLGPAVDAVSC
mmetsp:Transcript_843/g.1757  ORF Transcript_843/g.1757 Transcript_843/m.1757 type:complete len:431 (+) Transcript_843:69-1361(+)